MQNRNNTIEERLQIINDYIQRTMDALNATRQVVQGLSSTTTNYQQGFVPPSVGGISHTTFVPQVVQTPYGFVTVNAAQLPQWNQVPQFGLGYGLNHTAFIPQLSPWQVAQLGVQQLGVPQVGLPQWNQVPQFGLGYGLNHTSFIPQVNPWQTMPMHTIAQWPMQQNLGVNAQAQVVPNVVQGQTF